MPYQIIDEWETINEVADIEISRRRLAIDWLRFTCGEIPHECSLDFIVETDHNLTFTFLALVWFSDQQRLVDGHWQYISRCKQALGEFYSILDNSKLVDRILRKVNRVDTNLVILENRRALNRKKIENRDHLTELLEDLLYQELRRHKNPDKLVHDLVDWAENEFRICWDSFSEMADQFVWHGYSEELAKEINDLYKYSPEDIHLTNILELLTGEPFLL